MWRRNETHTDTHTQQYQRHNAHNQQQQHTATRSDTKLQLTTLATSTLRPDQETSKLEKTVIARTPTPIVSSQLLNLHTPRKPSTTQEDIAIMTQKM